MRPIFTKINQRLSCNLTTHVQNLFATNYKIPTGEINEYESCERALWVYLETRRSDQVRFQFQPHWSLITAQGALQRLTHC